MTINVTVDEVKIMSEISANNVAVTKAVDKDTVIANVLTSGLVTCTDVN